MNALGMPELGDEQVANILNTVKQAGIKKRDILTDDEFIQIVNQS